MKFQIFGNRKSFDQNKILKNTFQHKKWKCLLVIFFLLFYKLQNILSKLAIKRNLNSACLHTQQFHFKLK